MTVLSVLAVPAGICPEPVLAVPAGICPEPVLAAPAGICPEPVLAVPAGICPEPVLAVPVYLLVSVLSPCWLYPVVRVARWEPRVWQGTPAHSPSWTQSSG